MPLPILLVCLAVAGFGGAAGGFVLSDGTKRLSGALLLVIILLFLYGKVKQHAT